MPACCVVAAGWDTSPVEATPEGIAAARLKRWEPFEKLLSLTRHQLQVPGAPLSSLPAVNFQSCWHLGAPDACCPTSCLPAVECQMCCPQAPLLLAAAVCCRCEQRTKP